MPPDLLKMHHNIVNDLFDFGNHLGESENCRSVPFWKLYVRGYVGCHFHFYWSERGEGCDFYPCHFCADVQVCLGMGVIRLYVLTPSELLCGPEAFGEVKRLGANQYWF